MTSELAPGLVQHTICKASGGPNNRRCHATFGEGGACSDFQQVKSGAGSDVEPIPCKKRGRGISVALNYATDTGAEDRQERRCIKEHGRAACVGMERSYGKPGFVRDSRRRMQRKPGPNHFTMARSVHVSGVWLLTQRCEFA